MSDLFADPLPPGLEDLWRGLLARVQLGDVAPRTAAVHPDAEAMTGLYGPLVDGDAMVVGQMGQSLDGCIATRTGASHFVTGPESLVHLHRLRALVDAVVIGSATAAADDPRLTVRHVDGVDPVRVVVDLERALPDGLTAFTGPGRALRVAREGAPRRRSAVPEILVRGRDGRLDPRELVRVLAEHGWHRVLVEGGGRIVSSFLRAGALHRLHVVVAPLLIGAGVRGVEPEPVDDLAAALRPPSRSYLAGVDVLFDLDLSSGETRASTST